MSRKRTMMNSIRPVDRSKWNSVHCDDHDAYFDGMTLKDLHAHIKKLGLKQDDVRTYGSMTYKKSYIAAIRMAFVLNEISVSEEMDATGFFEDDSVVELQKESSALHDANEALKTRLETLAASKKKVEAVLREKTLELASLRNEIHLKNCEIAKLSRQALKRDRDIGQALVDMKKVYKRFRHI